MPADFAIWSMTLSKSPAPLPVRTRTLFKASTEPNSCAICWASPPVALFTSSRNFTQPTLLRCAALNSMPKDWASFAASDEGFRILLYAAFRPVTASLVRIPFFVRTAMEPKSSWVLTLSWAAMGMTLPMASAISPKDVLPKFWARSIWSVMADASSADFP